MAKQKRKAYTGPFRTFTPDSIWNTPLPADAPLSSDSNALIQWMMNNLQHDYLTLGDGDWALPVYWSTSADPLVEIDPKNGPIVTFRLPSAATSMTGNDAAMEVIDRTTGQDIQLFEFTRSPLGASGVARYFISSNGLDREAAGSNDQGNQGHRGLPGSTHCVRLDEVAWGKIAHRTKFAIGQPGQPSAPIWPMVGFESPRSGVVPEGFIMRIKPDYVFPDTLSPAALVIAKNLKRFGTMCGDTGGDGTCTLKLERTTSWAAMDIDRRALMDIPWSAYEFIEAGWGRV